MLYIAKQIHGEAQSHCKTAPTAWSNRMGVFNAQYSSFKILLEFTEVYICGLNEYYSDTLWTLPSYLLF